MNYNNDYNWAGGKKSEWRCPVSLLLIILCITIVGTMLITFNFASNWVGQQDLLVIQQQQQTIDNLNNAIKEQDKWIDYLQGAYGSDGDFKKLEILATLLKNYSYNANNFNEEEMLEEVLHAYIKATGDDYAAYYTEEEYAEILSDNSGSGIGVGVSVVQESLTVSGQEYLTFQIITIFQNSPANSSGLLLGDHVYAIEVDGEYQTISQLGGYTTALKALRGDAETTVKLRAFRDDGNGGYNSIEFAIVRNTYTRESVTFRVSETDSSIGIVQIAEFDLQAPIQFKQAVQALQKQGIQKIIFDVRDNPGGDLQSIKAVLSCILNDGDLILSAINNEGEVDYSVYAGQLSYTGSYVTCNVAQEEVGMFANLKMVVLCNNNTASAAEVFTASLRDHKNVTIVGETTFGKGIMQRYISLASLTGGAYDGWVKMTTHAYLTECGVTYHNIGIPPTEGYDVALDDAAKEYNFYLLPESLDNQLQKAIEAVNK